MEGSAALGLIEEHKKPDFVCRKLAPYKEQQMPADDVLEPIALLGPCFCAAATGLSVFQYYKYRYRMEVTMDDRPDMPPQSTTHSPATATEPLSSFYYLCACS